MKIQSDFDYLCVRDLKQLNKIQYIKGTIYRCTRDRYLLGEDKKWHYIDDLSAQTFFELYKPTNKKYPEQPPIKEDKVNHPSHYTWLKSKCGIEVIDITRHLNFNIGNVIKYCLRAGHKTEQGYNDTTKHIEDLKKAKFYIEDEITRLEQIN